MKKKDKSAVKQIKDDFGVEGILSQQIAGFNPREAQWEMAQAISSTIEQTSQIIIEAGTGTGKTYAYLVPALRSGRKLTISTGSKTLQEQLFKRDLPTISRAIGYKGKLALLKGRSNYLCLERLERESVQLFDVSAEQLTDLMQLRSWRSVTQDGDIGSCEQVREESSIWGLVTSTNDNCLGGDCPFYQDCFVNKARRKALEADVVVINHHIFFADKFVKETGFAELLPKTEVMIFDEAHLLPDIASHYFGQQISSKQLMNLARDILLIYRTELTDVQQLSKSAESLSNATNVFRAQLGEPGFRGNLRYILQQEALLQSFIRIEDALEFCHDVVQGSVGRSAALERVLERISLLRIILQQLKNVTRPGYSYWFECSTRHFILALTPLSVRDKFQDILTKNNQSSWIFTSATLSVNGEFSHYQYRMGLDDSDTLLLSSPFDYQKQALLCVPRYLPSPNQVNTAEKLVERVLPIIESNTGGCFFLCTSHTMMREITQAFRQHLTLPILMQGETSKSHLLNKFIQLGNALLVATYSFWEGVDVRGQALSCVIIDKLPFTSPDDPLMRARVEECRLRGEDPFYTIQLPEAVITLKQGVGRLIRDPHDRGVLIICDPRLVTRPYGEVFLKSLPNVPRTRDIQRAVRFYQQE